MKPNNGDKADNRWANLRDVSGKSNRQNIRGIRANKRADAPLGVWANPGSKRNPWVAYIYSGYARTYLGSFPSKEAAHEAYLTAKRRLHEGCTI